MSTHIYLARVNETVYRIGRTRNIMTYPPPSEVMFAVKIEHANVIKERLISKLSRHFEQRHDIGKGCFQGDYETIIQTVLSHMTFLKT